MYNALRMIDEKSIFELRDRIAAEFQPQRIIMFGSYAHGNPNEDSDLDVLVILRYVGSGLKKAVEILNRIEPRIPVDLVVRTPEEVRQRLQANDFFLAEVLRHGRVLYEALDQ
jgi:predicted nucleotidyltransferase